MAIRNDILIDDDKEEHYEPTLRGASGSRTPNMLKVTLANGKTMEVPRPRIIRTRRLDSMTLNRDVVRALGRLEARTRDIGKIKDQGSST